jgi:hypothetical protein
MDKFIRLLKQYDISCDLEEIHALKLYFAQEGVLDLSNRENISESQIVINNEKLLSLLRTICQDLYIPVTAPKEKVTS